MSLSIAIGLRQTFKGLLVDFIHLMRVSMLCQLSQSRHLVIGTSKRARDSLTT